MSRIFHLKSPIPCVLAVILLSPGMLHAAGDRPLIEGLWVWKSVYITDQNQRDQMLQFCQDHGFNRLLVQVPWKAGSVQPNTPASAAGIAPDPALTPQIRDEPLFALLIAQAAKRHIAVEALDGDPYMGDAGHRAETLATVDALLAFNSTLPTDARLAGIHWDIEPYTRPDWKVQATRVPIETDYLQLLQQTRHKLQDAGSSMTLAVDIPMWYDNKTAPDDNCIVTFHGETKNFHMHIQDVCDYVGIMSYRRNALGPNSAAEQVANELAYANKIGKFICPAFETTQLKETPKITFFGQPGSTFLQEKQKLEDALRSSPGFGGMLIHCYPAVRVVLETPATQP